MQAHGCFACHRKLDPFWTPTSNPSLTPRVLSSCLECGAEWVNPFPAPRIILL